MVDLGEGPLFWVKKEEMTEGRKAGRASKSTFPPAPFLSSRLDPPLTPVAGCYFFATFLSLFVSDIVLLIIINFVFYRLMFFLME